MSKLAALVQEIESKSTEQKAIFDEADEKTEGELSDEQYAAAQQLGTEIKDLEQKAKRIQATDAMRGDVDTRMSQRNPEGRVQHSGGQPDGQTGLVLPPGAKRLTLGDQFLAADEYKAWRQLIAPKGHITPGMGIQSPRVEVKELITSDPTSGGAMVWPDVQTGLTLLGRRPLVMRDVVTVGTTDSDLVEYARVVAESHRAAVVPEANNAYDDNGLKPESDFELEKVQAPVKTIAHMVTTTTRALSDAGQLRTMIDGFLRDGLAQALEDEMVTGDGTGEHFEGLEAIEGIQEQGYDTDNLVTARKARTKVRINGRAIPTAYLFNPLDWEAFDLMREEGNTGSFYFGGPMVLGNPRLWGLPVVESEAVPEGTGYVGDFRTLVLWDRMQAAISLSNSHKDYFQRNLVAILGEIRAAFGALRPAAIVRIALESGT